MRSWEVKLRPSRVVFGPGRLEEVGELVRELGGRRVLVVTDAGIRSAGHVDTAVESLLRAQLSPCVFDEVAENPTTRHVGLGVESARSSEVDFIVGLGGGSAMDCAKGINFLVSNGGCMEEYWGFNRATKPMLTQRDLSLAYSPGVAVPCLEIAKEPLDAFRYTARGNLVGVISNGTAVLGLGNIGALAGKPVMEGAGRRRRQSLHRAVDWATE